MSIHIRRRRGSVDCRINRMISNQKTDVNNVLELSVKQIAMLKAKSVQVTIFTLGIHILKIRVLVGYNFRMDNKVTEHP